MLITIILGIMAVIEAMEGRTSLKITVPTDGSHSAGVAMSLGFPLLGDPVKYS